jgi:hypothetical protein
MSPASKEEEDIWCQFSSRGLTRGGEVYLDIGVMQKMVAEVERSNLLIVGIEGFLLSEESLQPRLDLIADFSDASADSWEEMRRICNKAARDWIESINKNSALYLTATILSEHDWSR